ncbi:MULTISPECIES: GNAT family N-acetyltransferase [unclassified Rathayibacter]|uniref:GNAT family N-acetyltransferase n=1 Tax=unclassified Rathayibacter TaxID=2609250 RepID=UPI000CE7A7EC|nr:MULTISPECIES: GNAT family N-acetyltransferase [unclassified Rathayibacter]PPF29602.1 GNAT family N-acetyltransferase [Rathayibacter sp. AY1F2]PPH43061.1 GNAT family N-acetyltransferase [Rathayibacter sp. AY1F7]PPH48624.1 GNAT family N-acetyltransferase [Rathayibacter sp. AY1C9]QHF20909.1 GNAT family N-acetyltransferase [Rathayibacter sp. VKM Ac-2762]
MTVRRASAADAEALAELAAATFPLACPPHTTAEAKAEFVRTVLSVERFRDHLADPLRSLLVDDDSGALTGYAMLVRGEPADADVVAAIRLRPTVELSKFYLLPGRHGSGAAAALMAATLEEARAHGAAGVWLGVNEENARAQRFYSKHGFAVVGRKRFLVGDRWEDDFVLERSLA